MASVRKRKWVRNGETRSSWILDYTDAKGRHVQTFATKKLADAALIRVGGEVARGVHTADSDSATVADACNLWIKRCELRRPDPAGEVDALERSTVRGYRQHVNLHIVPMIGAVKLSRLTAPTVEAWKDQLQATRSRSMTRRLLQSLRCALSEAMRIGIVAQNVAREVKIAKRARHKRKLEIGRDIPTKDEVRVMLAHVTPRWRPLLMTVVFTGLRASELRGLRWVDLDLTAGVLHVRQRADRWNDIGSPKSEAARREVLLAPIVVNTLREWRLACPKGERSQNLRRNFAGFQEIADLDLVFPNGAGRVCKLNDIKQRCTRAAQIAAGVVTVDGMPKYGLHAMRHFYASWLIDQGFPAKRVQQLMGHSTITLTLDTYAALFPVTGDERERLAVSAAALIG